MAVCVSVIGKDVSYTLSHMSSMLELIVTGDPCDLLSFAVYFDRIIFHSQTLKLDKSSEIDIIRND
jgi:hypothetical protein